MLAETPGAADRRLTKGGILMASGRVPTIVGIIGMNRLPSVIGRVMEFPDRAPHRRKGQT